MHSYILIVKEKMLLLNGLIIRYNVLLGNIGVRGGGLGGGGVVVGLAAPPPPQFDQKH